MSTLSYKIHYLRGSFANKQWSMLPQQKMQPVSGEKFLLDDSQYMFSPD